jgi:phosphoribosylaminoimidazole-succinocarboxamide synthase
MLLKNTDFINLPVFAKGKVRDVYEVSDDLLLMVTTDRISAFDVVFDDLIPCKGKVLNTISEFWFNLTQSIIGNHVVTTDVSEYPMGLNKFKSELQGRSMLVKRVKMEQVECIVRGYLEGSGLKDYNATGAVCGIKLPKGLRQADKLPEPVFSPSTKASEGHDVNISFAELAGLIGSERAAVLRDKSLQLYNFGSEYAKSKGIIIADTKFEFGYINGELVIADELFTPDSSRFWPAAEYQPGKAQKSFDKQYLREYLENLGWDKRPPAPRLPKEVIEKTQEKYIEICELITGEKFS